MKITAFDLVHLVDAVERVSASKIPDAQKTLVLAELRNAVPEPIFCAASLETRDYVLQTIEGAIHGCAEKTKSQIPVKKGTRASPRESPKEKLLPDTNGDGRGKSVETEMVNETPKKRGKATRSS